MMDPAISRFVSVDPLAEKYYSISPYAYTANNPIRFIDPDGREYGDPEKDREANPIRKEITKAINTFFSYLASSMGLNPDQMNSENQAVRDDAKQRRIDTAENIETANEVLSIIVPGASVVEVAVKGESGDINGTLAAVPFAILDGASMGKGSGTVKTTSKAIVIGEGMYRIKPTAKSMNAKWYQA